ncbi:MAG: SHOCT domain-containing protein [Thermoanaerobacterales bacterium]
MLIAEVGLGDMIWTALWVFFLAMFVWIFIAIVSDLFRDHELSGAAKAAWIVGLVVFPLLGSLAYIVVRGDGMARRSAARHELARQQLDAYIRSTATSTGAGPVDDLARLVQLRESGVITDDEFQAVKSRIIGAPA